MNDTQRELISALFDGELDAERRAEAERLLADDAECRRWWDELAAMRDTLRSLPAISAADDLADRVLRGAERAMFLDSSDARSSATGGATPRHVAAARGDVVSDTPRPDQTRPSVGWLSGRRPLVWSAAVVAATLVVIVSISLRHEQPLALTEQGVTDREEPAPQVAGEPTSADAHSDSTSAVSELESLNRSRVEPGFDKAGTVPTRAAAPTAPATARATNKAGAASPAEAATDASSPRFANDSPARALQRVTIESDGYGTGGYGKAGRGVGDYAPGSSNGAASGGFGVQSGEAELTQQLVTAAAQRRVYVVEVDVPPGTDGGERLNKLLANRQVVVAATKPSTASAGKDIPALSDKIEAADDDVINRSDKVDANGAAIVAPRYFYGELTKGQLDGVIDDMRSQGDVFHNVALIETPPNQSNLELFTNGEQSEPRPQELFATDEQAQGEAANGASASGKSANGTIERQRLLSTSRNDRTNGGNQADQTAPVSNSSQPLGFAYQVAESPALEQGAVVDLGNLASTNASAPQAVGRVPASPVEQRRAESRLADDSLQQNVALNQSAQVTAPAADPVVEQAIVDGQQMLSQWRAQNVIAGQQMAVPATDAPANETARGPADVAQREPDENITDKKIQDRNGESATQSVAAPPVASQQGQRRSVAQQAFGALDSAEREHTPQQLAQPNAAVEFYDLMGRTDRNLVGTVFILRPSEKPSAAESKSERPAPGDVDEAKSGGRGENDALDERGDGDAKAESDASGSDAP